MRNMKVLGLAVVAVLALSAVVASAASAHVFKSTLSSTTIKGTQTGNHVFEAAGNKITCKKATFAGTQTGTTSETLLTSAEYGECTAFSIVGVNVSMGGCQYEFNANESVSVVGSTCNSNPITYEANGGILGKCIVKIGATSNTGLKTVSYANGTGINVTPSVKGITYTSEGGLCGSHTEGKYTEGKTNVVSTNGATISWE